MAWRFRAGSRTSYPSPVLAVLYYRRTRVGCLLLLRSCNLRKCCCDSFFKTNRRACLVRMVRVVWRPLLYRSQPFRTLCTTRTRIGRYRNSSTPYLRACLLAGRYTTTARGCRRRFEVHEARVNVERVKPMRHVYNGVGLFGTAHVRFIKP